MERLHATTVHLLRYGGLYPFKKTNHSNQTNYSNQTSLSVWLLLWTVFLNLMVGMCALYSMIALNSSFSSLDQGRHFRFPSGVAMAPPIFQSQKLKEKCTATIYSTGAYKHLHTNTVLDGSVTLSVCLSVRYRNHFPAVQFQN